AGLRDPEATCAASFGAPPSRPPGRGIAGRPSGRPRGGEMKRLVSLIAATALLATALAVPASARTGEACEEGTYSNTWLCATIKGPNVVTLSRTKSVNFELTVDYTASHAVEIDTNNYIRLTSQSTGSTWAFQLHSVGAKRDWVKLVAAPGLPTGRYTV